MHQNGNSSNVFNEKVAVLGIGRIEQGWEL